MGNRIINIKEVVRLEKDILINNYYRIYMKNGDSHFILITEDIPLLRLENYLRMPYSRIVSDKLKAQISQENKNCIPIKLNEVTFVFDQPQKSKKFDTRNIYIQDIIAYHKLLVHRGAFESLITKILENREEIYTQEFQNNFSNERDKFLELLKKKTALFTTRASKL